MQRQRVLDLFRASGDASLGQTLSRLARLAAAVHRFENAGLPTGGAAAPNSGAPVANSLGSGDSTQVVAATSRDSMEDAR